MTEQQAISCVAILAGAYTRHEITRENLETYSEMLRDLDFEATQGAVKRLICKNKFFPAISEIRSEVANAACAGLLPAEIAWGEVLRQISKTGHSKIPTWSNPAMKAAVDAVGWRNICLTDNETSTRARFIDAYRAMRLHVVETVQLGDYVAPSRERVGGAKSIKELIGRSERGE